MITVKYDRSKQWGWKKVEALRRIKDETIIEYTMTNDFYRWNKKTDNFNVFQKGKWIHNPNKIKDGHYRVVLKIIYTKDGFHPLKNLLWMFQILVLGKLNLSNGSICWFSKWIFDVHSFKREHGGDGMVGGTWKKYRCNKCYKRFSWDNDGLTFFRIYIGFFGSIGLLFWLFNFLMRAV